VPLLPSSCIYSCSCSNMVLQGYKATSAKLANGELVFVNGQSSSIQPPKHVQIWKLTAPDHVYVSPPWSDRDGELHPTSLSVVSGRRGLISIAQELHIGSLGSSSSCLLTRHPRRVPGNRRTPPASSRLGCRFTIDRAMSVLFHIRLPFNAAREPC
jgi:hypothetical protein